MSTSEIQSALSKHVTRFTDAEHDFSPTTVSAGLDKIHSSHPSAKGAAIATFNATHMPSNIVCPVTGARFVPHSKLKAYLARCYEEDPQDSITGRNANSWFSSKRVQGFASNAAWDETFDRLTCGWQTVAGHPKELEPFIDLSLARLFFEDSVSAFQKAEAGE